MNRVPGFSAASSLGQQSAHQETPRSTNLLLFAREALSRNWAPAWTWADIGDAGQTVAAISSAGSLAACLPSPSAACSSDALWPQV